MIPDKRQSCFVAPGLVVAVVKDDKAVKVLKVLAASAVVDVAISTRMFTAVGDAGPVNPICNPVVVAAVSTIHQQSKVFTVEVAMPQLIPVIFDAVVVEFVQSAVTSTSEIDAGRFAIDRTPLTCFDRSIFVCPVHKDTRSNTNINALII
jgi:hypothetical protein